MELMNQLAFVRIEGKILLLAFCFSVNLILKD